ncbi:hypothetical protein GGS26DRAFT_591055 [Hypomontagnella submonticulosa]|nr:hypothetical protein GGS26DRAFT_591055 [Hypomontagnella submonticulosa]
MDGTQGAAKGISFQQMRAKAAGRKPFQKDGAFPGDPFTLRVSDTLSPILSRGKELIPGDAARECLEVGLMIGDGTDPGGRGGRVATKNVQDIMDTTMCEDIHVARFHPYSRNISSHRPSPTSATGECRPPTNAKEHLAVPGGKENMQTICSGGALWY